MIRWRVRLTGGQEVEAICWPPAAAPVAGEGQNGAAVGAGEHGPAALGGPAGGPEDHPVPPPSPSCGEKTGTNPCMVVAVLAAGQASAWELVAACAQVAGALGWSWAVLDLAPPGSHREPAWASAGQVVCLDPAAPPAPDPEEALARAAERARLVVAHLGSGWQARLFRPLFQAARSVWVCVPAGAWAALEDRLDQMDLAGWVDWRRVTLVVLGDGPVPPAYRDLAAVALPDAASTRRWVMAVLGGGDDGPAP